MKFKLPSFTLMGILREAQEGRIRRCGYDYQLKEHINKQDHLIVEKTLFNQINALNETIRLKDELIEELKDKLKNTL